MGPGPGQLWGIAGGHWWALVWGAAGGRLQHAGSGVGMAVNLHHAKQNLQSVWSSYSRLKAKHTEVTFEQCNVCNSLLQDICPEFQGIVYIFLKKDKFIKEIHQGQSNGLT